MSTTRLDLARRLDLPAVGPLRRDILARRGGDLALDAAEVDHLGALALQVIRAAARTWCDDGHALSMQNASDTLSDQLALLGFTADTVTEWRPPR